MLLAAEVSCSPTKITPGASPGKILDRLQPVVLQNKLGPSAVNKRAIEVELD